MNEKTRKEIMDKLIHAIGDHVLDWYLGECEFGEELKNDVKWYIEKYQTCDHPHSPHGQYCDMCRDTGKIIGLF